MVSINTFDCSPNGEFLVVGYSNGLIVIANVMNYEILLTQKLEEGVSTITVSQDSIKVFINDLEDNLYIWKLSSQEPLIKLFTENESTVIRADSGSKFVLAIGMDSSNLLDINNLDIHEIVSMCTINTACFIDDEKFVTGDECGYVDFKSIANKKVLQRVKVGDEYIIDSQYIEHSNKIYILDYFSLYTIEINSFLVEKIYSQDTEDEKFLIDALQNEDDISVFEGISYPQSVEDKISIATLQAGNDDSSSEEETLPSYLIDLSISQSENIATIVDYKGILHVLKLPSGEIIRKIKNNSSPFESAKVLPQGDYILTLSDELALWDTKDFKKLHVYGFKG